MRARISRGSSRATRGTWPRDGPASGFCAVPMPGSMREGWVASRGLRNARRAGHSHSMNCWTLAAATSSTSAAARAHLFGGSVGRRSCGGTRSVARRTGPGACRCAVQPIGTLCRGHRPGPPVPDASFDVVIFFNSLHHVPAESMDAALLEAARVLRSRVFCMCRSRWRAVRPSSCCARSKTRLGRAGRLRRR